MIRISLILAIIGGLAAATINFVMLKEKITTTISDRDKNAHDRDTERSDKVKAQNLAKATQATLDTTKKDLATTRQEKDTALAQAADATKKYGDLTEVLKQRNADLQTTKDSLAKWESLGPTIDQIKATIASIRKVNEENGVLKDENKLLFASREKYQALYKSVVNPPFEGTLLPEGLTGKVVAVDPKFDFVVLNIGEKQGVLQDGQMLISDAGKLVARVRITGVNPDTCIANIMPNSKYGEVREGDQAVLPYLK